MSVVVLVVLAAVWAVFLIPQLLRSRTEAKARDSIGAFRRQLSVLGRTSPIDPGLGPTASSTTTPRRPVTASLGPVRRRRRDILLGLLSTMAGSLVLGLLPGLEAMLGLHLVLDALFVTYLVLLVRARSRAEERSTKVRYLPGDRSPEPALLLRRPAN